MIAIGLTAVLAIVLLWIIYDYLVDNWILGEYASVFCQLVGLSFFCEAVFKLLVRYV